MLSKFINKSAQKESIFSSKANYAKSLLLKVSNLKISVKQGNQQLLIVKNIGFHIDQNECVGIIGESGCGKSLTANTLACLGTHQAHGEAFLEGVEYFSKSQKEKQQIRSKDIGIIFQNPQASLNPTMIIGEQIREVSRHLTKADVYQLLQEVGLSDYQRCYTSYPHEMSGGMCQRIMIAMAIAKEPKLLIADEPTTALDSTTQGQILDLMKSIMTKNKMGILLVTHDFGVLERICDRVLVMYEGEIVESGAVHQVMKSPNHSYTKTLLDSRPKPKRRHDAPIEA